MPPRRVSVPLRLVVEKLPLLVLSAASCVATTLAQGQSVLAIEKFSLAYRTGNALVSYVAYLGQFFYPVGLAVYYPHPGNSLPLEKVAGALVVLAGITGGAIACWRRCPWLLVGWFWYLGMLVPVIGLVQVGGQAMADRYTYLPQIGLVMALAWEAKHLLGSWPARAWLCGVTAVLVIAALMGCAWRQTSYWCNSETLWTHTLACTSGNDVAHNNLGALLADRGQVDEAIGHYRKAVDINPRYAPAHNNLANALAKQARFTEAIAEYQKALDIKPYIVQARNNLGVLLCDVGRIDEALEHLRKALEIDPSQVDTHQNLAFVLSRCGRMPEAIAQLGTILRLQPENTLALTQLAWARATSPLASLRNGAEAIELAQRAARLTAGRDLNVLDALAAAYAEAGRFSEAVQTAGQALALASSQNDTARADALRARIKLYEAGSPYRDTH